MIMSWFIELQPNPPGPKATYENLIQPANNARIALERSALNSGWAYLNWSDGWATIARKSAGIPTTISPHHKDSLQGRIRQLPSFEEYAPAHRLDIDTSGLVVGGNHRKSRNMLARQFREHEVVKMYLALTQGDFPHEAHGFISEPLATKGRKVRVATNGKPSLTEYQLLDTFSSPYGGGTKLNLLLVKLHSGRKHQIRAHMAYIDSPLVGDSLYGSRGGNGQFLHASYLRIPRLEKWSHDAILIDHPDWLLAGQIPSVDEGIKNLDKNYEVQ